MIALIEDASPQTIIDMVARGYTTPLVLVGVLYVIWRVIRRSFPWIEALVKSHIEFVRALQTSQLDIRDRLTAIEEAITRRPVKRRREDHPEGGESPN